MPGSPNRRLSWLDWLNTLLVGLLLGGVQGLPVFAEDVNWLGPMPWWILLGSWSLSALLLPGYAGWVVAAQTGERRAGKTHGCTVGLLGFVLFTLLFVWGLKLLIQSHQRSYVILVPQFLVLATVVEVVLAVCGTAFGVERGLRRSGLAPQAADAEGQALEEEH